MPDTLCSLGVDNGKVWLEFDGAQYSAPVRDDPLVKLLVKRLDRFVTHHMPGSTGYEDADLKLLGAALFNILFGQQASLVVQKKKGEAPEQQLLDKTLGDVLCTGLQHHDDAGGSLFRIALEFSQDAEALSNFPWEFLFFGDPDSKGDFLSKKATLYRLIKAGGLPQFSSNLKVVVAWAIPPNFDGLTTTAIAAKEIETAFQGSADCHLKVTEWQDVTWTDFETSFRASDDDPIDILHIIAHGRRLDADVQLAFRLPEMERLSEQAELQKQNPHGQVDRPDWIMVRDLANLLTIRPPRLVFLHACSVGRTNPGVGAFRGAAELIAGAGVPVVVAMQYEIENTDAEKFTSVFYKTIATPGATIDEAVRKGRLELAATRPSWGHRRFATPIIFLSDPTARVVTGVRRDPKPVGDFAPCPFIGCTNQIKVLSSICNCDKRRTMIRCNNGHPNDPEENVCWRVDCQKPLAGQRVSAPPGVRSSGRELDGM